MNDVLLFLAAPTAMCIVLAGIHCYLGLHVLARGVIFVDLSLAQVAAFGATLALLLGFEHDSLGSYLLALGSTLLASLLFAQARRYERLFPQEAVIGIVYALGAAAVILVVDQLAHGSEHIKELLVGQILWVTWPAVWKTALIYAAVAAVHYLFRKQLIAASFDQPSEHTPTPPDRARWDFLFYALFGVIITSSVKVAGVLQVFAFLIVPAIVSRLFFSSLRARLLFGWLLGAILSIIGMAGSYHWDLPSGALIVALFTIVPLGLLLLAPLQRKMGQSSVPFS